MAKREISGAVTRLTAASKRCPICGKPAVLQHQPFCSSRCANIDLGRWLNGNYRVETDEPPEEGGEEGNG